MPRQRKSQQLPRTMTQLAVVMEGKSIPCDCDKVFSIVRDVLRGRTNRQNPVNTVNRRLGQLRRRDPNTFRVLETWLQDANTQAWLARLGQSGNRDVWECAVKQILSGNRASSAFGAKPGPKPKWQFSAAQSDALLVRHMVETEGQKVRAAIPSVLAKSHRADDLGLRRAYKESKKFGLSREDLEKINGQ